VIIIWFILAFVFNHNPFSLQAMQALTRETTEISRLSYLATQVNVLWTYISLFFWPIHSHIDYDYPITERFLYVNENYHLIARILHSQALWASVGHLIILGIAFYNLRRRPLPSFSILFYYLAHTVESSLIPIRDVIFEHRTYLPNLGLSVLCSWILVAQLSRWLNKQFVKATIAILLIAMSGVTWERNQMWRDPIALWQDNVEQAPNKQRGWIILGKHLIQAGKPMEGIKALERSIEDKVNPDGSHSMLLTPETALNMVVAYKMLRRYDEALRWIDRAFQHPLRPFDEAKFLVNQGNIFYEQGRYAQAEASYRRALKIYPQNLKAQANLASILGMTGRIIEAKKIYQDILAIDPNDEYVKENLRKLQIMTPTP
jgi:tetratricopeptide (TPR) repeat protein